MTRQELKALCERVLADDPKMTVHPVRLADACLRLLAENEQLKQEVDRMKRVVLAATQLYASSKSFDECVQEREELSDAISKLGDT